MADPVGEIKAALERLVERRVAAMDAQRGVNLAPAAPAGEPDGPSFGTQDAAIFSTGYDAGTGETVLPFTWGVSIWGDPDVWVG